MADVTPYNLNAVRDDGFVDFYELLGMPETTPSSDLQERIQTLYSEAQANRDHRNLNKRRDYQTLLEYLPKARTVLLDPPKRAAYDNYAAQARGGSASTSFASFLAQLSGDVSDDERTDVLGVQDGRGKAGTPSASSGARNVPRSTPDAPGGVARRQPQVSSAKSGPPVAIIAVVVVVILLVLFFLLKR
jgi:DnaJ-class molecular chaperone